MNEKTLRDLLPEMFTTVKIQDRDEERICFSNKALSIGEYSDEGKNKDAAAVYSAISDAMRESGLTHDFSYEIASPALDILIDLEDWDDEDAITEAVDAAVPVPVYYAELMRIYAANWSIVDEACEELGTDEGDSTKRAQLGWYMAIERMTRSIRENLRELIAE